MDNYGLVGKSGTFKAIQRGHPEVKGKIVNADTAILGLVRIQIEDGSKIAAFYPGISMD